MFHAEVVRRDGARSATSAPPRMASHARRRGRPGDDREYPLTVSLKPLYDPSNERIKA
jgi:hypothetical protein